LKNEINKTLSADCEANIPMKKKPKIIIYNVPKNVNNDNIVNSIIEQNHSLISIITEENKEQNINSKEFWPMGAMCRLCVHFEFFDWIL
jgi:hypothetical protein